MLILDVVTEAAPRGIGRPDVTTAVARDAALTAADRCDRCGAQAYVRAELPGGGELLFCAHHGRKHADELAKIALYIHDETDRLADTPATAPEEEF
jgi:hypothetical protein